jgi:hypothetical protein
VFSVEGTTYIYRPIDGFAKLAFVTMLSVEGTTYIYRPIDGFTRVEFV